MRTIFRNDGGMDFNPMKTIAKWLSLAMLALFCSGCWPLAVGLGIGAGVAVGGYEMHHHVLHDAAKAPKPVVPNP
jgi:hypothetical protein